MRLSIVGLACALLIAQLGLTVANIGLPTMMTSLGVSYNDVQWVVLSYLIALTALSVTAGWLGDRYGKRRMLLAGIVVFTVASIACAIAPNLFVLVCARVVQGAGAALMSALSLALVVDVVPQGKAGSAVGALSATSAIGTKFGPSIGALMIGLGGWRAIFAINVPLAILAFVILLLTVAAPVAKTARAAVVAGATNIGNVIRASLAMNVLVSGVMIATLMIGPFVLSRTFGLQLRDVGFVMACGPLTTTLTAIPAGRFADKLDGRLMTVLGLAAFTLGAVAMALLQPEHGLIRYIGAVVMLGFGYGIFQTSNNTVVLSECPPGRRGVISGWLGLSRNVGLIGGAAIIGALFGSVIHGNAESGTVVAAAMRSAFTAATVMSLAAGALAVFVYLSRSAVRAA